MSDPDDPTLMGGARVQSSPTMTDTEVRVISRATPPPLPPAAPRPASPPGGAPAGPSSNGARRPSLGRATGVMAAGTLLSRITGFGQTLALTYALGQTALTDSYNVANTTPNIIYELILGGVLSATLVPVFVSLLARSDSGEATEAEQDAAWREVSAVVTIVGVVAVAAALVFALAAPLIIRLYLSSKTTPDQRILATTLLRMFAAQIVFYGIVSVTTAILQARRRFGPPMFAPVANNLIVISVFLAVPHVAHTVEVGAFRHNTGAVLLLGIGTTAGIFGMAAAQAIHLPKVGFRPRWVWDPHSPTVRRVTRLSGWTLGFVLANQVSLWVVYRLATSHAGDQSAYVNATLFFLLPHGVYAVSVMSALQPDMAERWHHHDLAGFARHVGTGLRSVAAIIIPAAAGLVLLAHPIVDTILRHGHLTAAGAERTGGTLAALAVGLPAFSLYLLLMRAYQAMQDTKTMFLVYLVENGVNIVAALALYPRFGVQGLGAAFAVAYMVGTAVALYDLRRRTDGLIGAGMLPFFGYLAVATTALFIAVAFTVKILPGGGLGAGLLQLGAGIVVGAFALLAEAVVLRIDEVVVPVRTVILAIRRRRKRRQQRRPM